jgi:hypothetical protein
MLEKISEAEFDAIFSLGANFFDQGKYKKALVIFHGLSVLEPENSIAERALNLCKRRLRIYSESKRQERLERLAEV